jgi:hypothetical protein
VIGQHRFRRLPAVTQEGEPEPGALRHGAARPEVADHEQRRGARRAEIHPAEVGFERRVVAEPLRLLVGVHVTADPGQQAGVVDNRAIGLVQPHVLGQPQRDQALPEHVLHRLSHAEVGRQRHGREKVGQADTRTDPGF